MMANDYGILGGVFSHQNEGLYNSQAGQAQANIPQNYIWGAQQAAANYQRVASGSIYGAQHVKMYSKKELEIYHMLGLWGWKIDL